MKIALVDIQSKSNLVINKDLSAGFGTSSHFGNNWSSILLTSFKRKNVKIPILMFGYLSSILTNRGYEVVSITNLEEVSNEVDLYIIYSSLIEHYSEIKFANKIKNSTNAKIAFVGPFATANPELFEDHSDFIIIGEPERVFLEMSIDKLPLGRVEGSTITNLDELPFPNWAPFDINSFSYNHYIKKKPFVSMITSRGCPYPCGYYCPYPSFQGNEMRFRSVPNILDEIEYLINTYSIRGILFRDPIFTIDKKRIEELADGIIKRKLDIEWVCETHLNRLDFKLIDRMYESGLRGINVGIESSDEDILKSSNRTFSIKSHQESIINYAEKIGIKIGAFYIFGMDEDTEKTILNTIEYAIKLNTTYAQFTISTPYPGTKFYEQVKDDIFEYNWEKYDIYHAVYNHPTISSEKLESLKEYAYYKYYFRPSWVWKYVNNRFLK